MPNDNDLLVDSSVTIDGCGDQLSERLGCVSVQIVWFELAESATWKVDCQTWCGVDEAGEERGELCD